MRCSKISSKWEIHSDICLLQGKRKILNKQSNFTPQGTRKSRIKKPKVSRRKEIARFRTDINEIETKKKIEKINEKLALHKDKEN